MKLYFYDKKKNHKTADTDVLILASVKAFCTEKGIDTYNGSVLRTDKGKPYLKDNALYVGVTHTDCVIIVCVSVKNFGIDCESQERVIKNPLRVMNRFFTDNERKYILDSQDTNRAFLEIWVKKEAYLKYTGEGIGGLCNCDVTAMNGCFTSVENCRKLIIYIYEDNNNE